MQSTGKYQPRQKAGQVTRESGRVASLLLSVYPSVRPIGFQRCPNCTDGRAISIKSTKYQGKKILCRPVALVACTSALQNVVWVVCINLPESQQISPQELGGHQHLCFEHFWKRATRWYKSLQVCFLSESLYRKNQEDTVSLSNMQLRSSHVPDSSFHLALGEQSFEILAEVLSPPLSPGKVVQQESIPSLKTCAHY